MLQARLIVNMMVNNPMVWRGGIIRLVGSNVLIVVVVVVRSASICKIRGTFVLMRYAVLDCRSVTVADWERGAFAHTY